MVEGTIAKVHLRPFLGNSVNKEITVSIIKFLQSMWPYSLTGGVGLWELMSSLT